MNIKIIKEKMKEKKLSKLALANIIEIDDKGLGQIVNGITKNPRIDTVIKIANALELSDDEFLQLCGYSKAKRKTGFLDKNGIEITEGDIITLLTGDKAVVKYGKHLALCPYDQMWMDTMGFYVEGMDKFKKAMPLGPTEEYAEIIGNIDNDLELLYE